MSPEFASRFAGWLQELSTRKGTELLMAEGEPPMIRVGGLLDRLDDNPLNHAELEGLGTEALGEHQIRELGADRAVAYASVELAGTTLGISAARSSGRLCLRALPIKTFTLNPTQVRTPAALLQALKAPGGGLVIVTGPPGCGKTTTAYLLLEHLNIHQAVHIVLAEYYSEWVFEAKRACMQQRQVGLDAPNMVSAIHSALVQEADVIFVGEIRDAETALACLHAAEAGRRVLTQLHEPTPEAAIERLATLEAGGSAARRLLSRHLRAVVAQRLLPDASGARRIPAHGVLIPDDEMRNAIAGGNDLLNRASPLPTGCQALAGDLDALVREGLVTREAADAVC